MDDFTQLAELFNEQRDRYQNKAYPAKNSQYTHGTFGFNSPGHIGNAYQMNQLPSTPMPVSDEECVIDEDEISGSIEKKKVVEMIHNLFEEYDEDIQIIHALSKLKKNIIQK